MHHLLRLTPPTSPTVNTLLLHHHHNHLLVPHPPAPPPTQLLHGTRPAPPPSQLVARLEEVTPWLEIASIDDKPLTEGEISDWVNPEGPHGPIIQSEFSRKDVNRDGTLDRDEALSFNSPPLPKELEAQLEDSLALEQMKEYQALKWGLADRDADGRLSKREFVLFHRGLENHAQVVQLYQRHHKANLRSSATRHMKRFDLNLDGYIDADELEEARAEVALVTHPSGLKKEEL